MHSLTARKEWTEMRENINRAVHSLEVCWKCQNVSECQKYVLGHTVLIWLCEGCLQQMEAGIAPRRRGQRRVNTHASCDTWSSFH